jgi:hypothetical protein
MNHPYEQLADLVDGTLDDGDLAGVQAHLDTCASCREDVAHATAGREAARSLPQAPGPADLHHRVLTAAGGRGNGVPDRGIPQWYRWAGVAAAAAVVVAIAIALPNVGGGKNKDSAGGAEATLATGPEAQEAASGAPVEVVDKNYGESGLQRLVSASASDTRSPEQTASTDASADPDAALRCVTKAVQNKATGRLIRLIQARFQGRAAYIAVYLESPGAGQQPDLVAAWVAARDDCSFLSLAYSRI